MSTSDTSIDDPFLPLAFSLFSNPGAYAVLAGAGVSRGAGLPTAWDIVVDLISQMAGNEDDGVEINAETAADWYETRFGRTPTYSDVVEQLALTPTERQRLLQKYFEPTDEDQSDASPGPATAHRAIARLMAIGVVKVVLTMNFDRLFEQALHELQIEPTVVATDSEARGLAPLHTVEHCVVHLHGDYLNANSMRNTRAELSGYGRPMKALLSRVLTDYGLLVAGWSVQHDHALRDLVAAHHRPIFTMGWISPGTLTVAAHDLAVSKNALILPTTADDAFGHLADQVHAMRERRARHPLSLSVAVNRIKRDLGRERPAIAAHDMLAAEFSRLRGQPAFRLGRFNTDLSNYQALLQQVVEASRLPAGCVAVLAYWGGDDTQRWWMPELERFARPFARESGTNLLLDLPLVAGSMMFYSAGVAAVASERFDLLAGLFSLRGHRTGGRPASLADVLRPGGLTNLPLRSHYDEVGRLVVKALGLGAEAVDGAIQVFELLRWCMHVMNAEGFTRSVSDYGIGTARVRAAAELDRSAQQEAWVERQGVISGVADWCRGVRGSHLLASEHTFDADEDQYHWANPMAERLADDVARLGERHPLVRGWSAEPDAMWLAIKGVSVAIGRAGRDIQASLSGWLPDEFWLDTGQPPEPRSADD